MGTYKPEKGDDATSVAPLLQFFELVHIGDTIQSMVQVYFDKELVSSGGPYYHKPQRFADGTTGISRQHILTRRIS
jgi:hypothetical protein